MLKARRPIGKETKNWIQLAYASSVGFAMLLAIFGGLFIGSWLDRQFGTGNKLTVLFLLIGVAAGMRNIYVLIKRNFPNEEDGPKRCIKNEPHRKRPPPKKA